MRGSKMTERLKGIVVWFINLYPDLGQSIESTMAMMKDMNKPLLARLAEDGRYVCLMIPTTKESTRVVKIDYNAPFPRYMPRSADVHKLGLPDNDWKEPKKEESFKGVINLFMNFCPEVNFEAAEVLALVQSVNEEAFKVISEDGRYQVMVVPTTKESSRVEKIDFDMPFPRFVSSGNANSVNSVTKLLKDMMDDYHKTDDENYDDIEDEELEEEKE
jgi:hypothetical protein